MTALRAGAAVPARVLAVRDGVWADDTLVTAEQASVAVRLGHNNGLWRLESGQTRRVDEAAAWRAPKQAADLALADRQEAPTTASAGRHSEQEAAQTGEAAARPGVASATEKAETSGSAAAAARRALSDEQKKKKAVEAVEKQGVLGMIGSNDGGSDLKDVLGGADATDTEAFGGLNGVGISGGGADRPRKGSSKVGGGGLGSIGGLGHGGGGSARVAPVAEVKITPQVKQGEAAPNDVESFISGLRPRIRALYQRALNADPTLTGALIVRVELNHGHVTGISVVSNVPQRQLVDCLMTPLKGARFGGPDEVVLELTVTFARYD